MKKRLTHMNRLGIFTLAAATMLASAGCGSTKTESASTLDPKNPVTFTIWNYYNGDQLASFEKLIEEFNTTVGTEKGIVAESVSQGDISTLADTLLESVAGKAGAQETPTLASVYAETAYILNQEEALVPLDPYFTEEELAAYIPGFLDEGRFDADNNLLLFPVSKSTEVFAVNKTDWDVFAADTGITLESIQTNEDLTTAAKSYYEWTDAQTPDVPEDGKSLYGRDSVGNYIYIGSYQLGHELFHVENGKLTMDLDRDTFKTLWDNYYIPYINGYFGTYAKFSSEDAKTGKILALTSSSSSMSYMPTSVTLEDDSTHDIELYLSKALSFENAKNEVSVQQGASYCMLKSTEAQQQAAVEFLKWFTESNRNLEFSLTSGYSPVTIAANTVDTITKAYSGDSSSAKGKTMLEALLIGADTFENSTTYATKPFNGSKDVRSALDTAMTEAAVNDRATVVASIAAGASHEEAVAPFTTDAYFDDWFAKLSDEVNSIVNN